MNADSRRREAGGRLGSGELGVRNCIQHAALEERAGDEGRLGSRNFSDSRGGTNSPQEWGESRFLGLQTPGVGVFWRWKGSFREKKRKGTNTFLSEFFRPPPLGTRMARVLRILKSRNLHVIPGRSLARMATLVT
jgi:hypothetical protein